MKRKKLNFLPGVVYFIKTKFSYHCVILFLLVVSISIGKYIWLSADTALPSENDLSDLIPATWMYSCFQDVGSIVSCALHPYKESPYPHLLPLSYALFFQLFGNSHYNLVLLTNCLYLAILLFSVYGIGTYIFDRNVGLLGAFILSSFPIIVAFTITPSCNFSTMSLVSLSLYFLLRSNNFKNSLFSALFGISMGLASLSKWDFIIYLIGPFSVIAYKSGFYNVVTPNKTLINVVKEKKDTFYVILNISISLILAGLIASTYYFNHVIILYNYFSSSHGPFGFNDSGAPVFSIKNLTFYLTSMVDNQIGPIYIVILIMAFVCIIIYSIKNNIHTRDRLHYVFLSFWLIFPYFIYSIIPVKRFPHTIGLTSPIAIIIAAGILKIKIPIIKISIIGLVSVYGLLIHLHPLDINFYLMNIINPVMKHIGQEPQAFHRPNRQAHLANFMEMISDSVSGKYCYHNPKTISVLLLINSSKISNFYNRMLYIKNLYFSHRTESDIEILCPESFPLNKFDLNTFSYLIIDDGDNDFNCFHRYPYQPLPRRFVYDSIDFINNFRLLKTLYHISGNYMIYINRRHEDKIYSDPIRVIQTTIIKAENFTDGANISTKRSDLDLPIGLFYDDEIYIVSVGYYLNVFESAEYGIWTTDMVAESRPVGISLDGQSITPSGFAQNSGNRSKEVLQTFKEKRLFLSAGKHWLVLKFYQHLPHIESMNFIRVDK